MDRPGVQAAWSSALGNLDDALAEVARLREALGRIARVPDRRLGIVGESGIRDLRQIARDALHPYCSDECDNAPGHDGPCGTFGGSGHL